MIRNFIQDVVADALDDVLYGADRRKLVIARARKYRSGYQPKRLRVKPPASDDNITLNFSGLIVERSISLLFGQGVEFDLPGEGESEQDTWLEACWRVNVKQELLHDLADYGATSGTPTILFDVESVYDTDGTLYPSMASVDPAFVTIITDPENYKKILAYEIRYELRQNANTIVRRRYIEPNADPDAATSWKIHHQEQQGNRWVELPGSPTVWAYDWAPILCWKNLPNAGSPYGRPDLTDDVLDAQDAVNLVASNINKVMRLQGHQRLWSKLFGKATKIDIGPDAVLNSDEPNAELNAIQANGGFSDMLSFLHELRDSMTAIARSTDPATLKDRVGQITNFGLRILYKDAIDKLATKRQLYGDALKECNRRLLILRGEADPDPGEIVWPEPLPQDETEQVAGYTFDLQNRIASRETIQTKRGYDPETENERIKKDDKEKQAIDANRGADILRNFMQNRGQPNQLPNQQTAQQGQKGAQE